MPLNATFQARTTPLGDDDRAAWALAMRTLVGLALNLTDEQIAESEKHDVKNVCGERQVVSG